MAFLFILGMTIWGPIPWVMFWLFFSLKVIDTFIRRELIQRESNR